MNAITPLAVSAEALLVAIRDNPAAGSKALADASGKDKRNIARDLDILANAGLIVRHPPRIAHSGLEALAAIARSRGPATNAVREGAPSREVPLANIQVQEGFNPRKAFVEADLLDLVSSITAKGVIQPILIRPADDQGNYWLVAGERRLRAATIVGLETIPAEVRTLTDAEAAEIALLENLQRKDLKPLEEAAAFKALVETSGKSPKEIAEAIGVTQRFVEQRLDLNKLDADDRGFLDSGKMTIEEARRRANAPKAADLGLTDSELMLLGEIAHRMEHLPKRKNDWQHRTECACDAKSDELDRLVSLRVIEIDFDTDGTGRRYIGRGHRWHDAMKLKPPMPAAAVYENAFLNGPFELSIAMQAAQAKKKEQRRADKVVREAKAMEKAQVQARIDRLLAESGDRPMNEVAAAARALLADMGVPLPWTIGRYEGVKAGDKTVALKPWQADDPPFVLQAVLVAAAALQAKPPRVHMAGSPIAQAEDASRPAVHPDVYEYNALSAGPAPGQIIFQLRAGDVVSTGGAMSYRLLAPVNRPASAFKAQPILRGKDHGSPRTIALNEISKVVEAAS